MLPLANALLEEYQIEFLNGIWMTLRNVTTIENIDSYRRTLLLAVLLPPELQGQALNGQLPMPPQARLHPEMSTIRSGTYALRRSWRGHSFNSCIDFDFKRQRRPTNHIRLR